MLIRVRGGFSGKKLRDYFEKGHKHGREYDRDELDERVALVGNLAVTEKLIDGMDRAGQRFLHVTLAVKEDFLSNEKLLDMVQRFERFAFAAFKKGEYNIYAEAHIPKIKGYYHAVTGEYIERKPHIHIIIPMENQENGMYLNPFGRVEWQEKYLDAFQEYINNELGLASPKDNPAMAFNDASEMFTRYSGRELKSYGRDERKDILEAVIEQKIEKWEDFKALLVQRYGSEGVHLAHAKARESAAQYFKVKPEKQEKALALNEGRFKRSFIELPTEEKIRLISEVAKADYIEEGQRRKNPDYIAATLGEWHDTRAREVRYVFNQSKAYKDRYKAATPDEQRSMLTDRADAVDAKSREEAARVEEARKSLIAAEVGRAPAVPVIDAAELDEIEFEPIELTDAELDAQIEDERPVQPGDVTEYLLDEAERQAAELQEQPEQDANDGHEHRDERTERAGLSESDSLRLAAEDLRAAATHLRASGRVDAVTDDAIRTNAENIAEFASAHARELGVSRERGEQPRAERIDQHTIERIEHLIKGGMSDHDARNFATAEHDLRAAGRDLRQARKIDSGAEQAARAHRANIALVVEAREFRDIGDGKRVARAVAKPVNPKLPSNWDEIRSNVSAERVLAYLSHKNGMNVEKYSVEHHTDGSPLIRAGTRRFKVNDFLTKEMRMDFYKDAVPLMKECYEAQQLGVDVAPRGAPKRGLWKEFQGWKATEGQTRRSAALQEIKRSNREEIGTIRQEMRDEKSRLYEQWRGKSKQYPRAYKDGELSRLRTTAAVREMEAKKGFRAQRDEHKAEFRSDALYPVWLAEKAEKGDVQALAELRRQSAKQAERERLKDRSAELGTVNTAQMQQAAPPLMLDMTYEVDRYGDVTYRARGEDLFRDSRLRVSILKHDPDTVETALRLSVMKFGKSIALYGDEAFKRECVEVAVARDLWIEFSDPDAAKMAEELKALRDAERSAARERAAAAQTTGRKVAEPIAAPSPERTTDIDAEIERRVAVERAEQERQAQEQQKEQEQQARPTRDVDFGPEF